MDDLFRRLKRERRCAAALFVVAAALIAAVQWTLAPEPPELLTVPASSLPIDAER